MKPIVFLGQEYGDAEFRREFPAYANYVKIVQDGADTPQKVEEALYRKQRESKHRGPRFGHPTRPRKRA